MTASGCPRCGTYSVHAHCSSESCGALECYRASCGWARGECHAKVEVVPWIAPEERVDGGRKMRFAPVVRVGTFERGAPWMQREIPSGWVFGEGDPWPMAELHAMWKMLQAIQGLRGVG